MEKGIASHDPLNGSLLDCVVAAGEEQQWVLNRGRKAAGFGVYCRAYFSSRYSYYLPRYLLTITYRLDFTRPGQN